MCTDIKIPCDWMRAFPILHHYSCCVGCVHTHRLALTCCLRLCFRGGFDVSTQLQCCLWPSSIDEGSEQAIPLNQVHRSSVLDCTALVHHQHLVVVRHGLQAVCDGDEGRAEVFPDCLLDEVVGVVAAKYRGV